VPPGEKLATRVTVRQARQLGYSGKLLIYPAPIEPMHRAIATGEHQLVYAHRVLEAFAVSQAGGDDVIAFDGQMIGAPIVTWAREVLKRGPMPRGS
jgi:citrate lyase subunit beta / citryl-CoA lyase